MHNKKIAKKSNELKSGQNELFTNPDADVAREFFRTKSRALKSKLSTVEEVVRTYLHDGDYIGIGGFGANRIPTAILHEIVRQGKKHLEFAGHTSTHDFQILVAGECFDRCDIAYIIRSQRMGYHRRKSNIPAFVELGHKFFRKRHYVLNYFRCKITTAISEGINNKIKRLSRMAYGYRDVHYFLLKIHQHCGLLNPRLST